MARPTIRSNKYWIKYNKNYFSKNKTRLYKLHREWIENNLERHKKYQKEYREFHKDKTKLYNKTYRNKNRKKLLELNSKYRKLYPDRYKKYRNNWKSKDSKKTKEKNYCRNKSRIIFQTKEPCLICGSRVLVHRHHFDYSRPTEIVFICKKHHCILHRKGNLRIGNKYLKYMASSRKNIKRNSTRVSAAERPFHQSMQRNYKSSSKPQSTIKVSLDGLKMFYPNSWEAKVEELKDKGIKCV